jgi:phage protein D
LTDKIVSIEGFALDSMSALSINGILNEGLSADMVKLVLEKADGNRQALSIGKSVFVGNK